MDRMPARARAMPLLIPLVLFAAYAPVLLISYGYRDDYVLLDDALDHQMLLFRVMLGYGRPVEAVLNWVAFGALHGVDGLASLRAVSISGIVLLALAFRRRLAAVGLPPVAAIGVAMLSVLMPPFQVYAAWAILLLAPWSALLAGLAFAVVEPPGPITRPWIRVGGACLLLVISVMIYQPTTMMFVVFAATAWLTAPRLPEPGRMIRAGVAIGAAMATDYVLIRLMAVRYAKVLPLPRASLTAGLASKLQWFLHDALVSILSLTAIPPSGRTAIWVGLGIVIGLCLYFPGPWRARLLRLGLAACLVPLSYLPNLAAQENWASYRTLAMPMTLIVLYAVLALLGLLRRLRAEALLPAIMAAAVLGAATLAMRNVLVEFALPQAIEYHQFAAAIRSKALRNAQDVYFILPQWRADVLAPVVRHEFGALSSGQVAEPPAMARLIWGEARGRQGKHRVPRHLQAGPGPAPAGYAVVDLRAAIHDWTGHDWTGHDWTGVSR